MLPPNSQKSAKQVVGEAAAALVEPGMVLGLGTGSTVTFFLDALAERMQSQELSLKGVATSTATADYCEELGLELTTLADNPELDLVIDGADEVDSQFRLIKGGGGALLREKIVAAAGRKVVIIVSSEKIVDKLGTTFLLPIEVMPFGYFATLDKVAQHGCQPFLRMTEDDQPFLTDNGNYILDCKFPQGLDQTEALHASLSQIPGVAEIGLFIGLCDQVLEGCADGTLVVHEKNELF